MKFTVKDRLLISALYPRESSIASQLIVRDLSDKVKVEEEEKKEIELKVSPTGITWNEEKAKEKEIKISKSELSFLKEQVTRIDKDGKATQDLLDLLVKIKNA